MGAINRQKMLLFLAAFSVLLLAAQPLPEASAQSWSLDSNGSYQSNYDNTGCVRIEAPKGTWYMFYTALPQNYKNFTISVEVNAKDPQGFYVIAKGDLPLVGETDDLTCSLGPLAWDGRGTQSTSATFDGVVCGGTGYSELIKPNNWYTLVIGVDLESKTLNEKLYNASGADWGGYSGPITPDILEPISKLKYVGFGSGINGGSYTVRNAKLVTDPPMQASQDTPLASLLSFSCQNSGMNSSQYKVDINGNITVNGTALPNAQIRFSYSIGNGTSWTNLPIVFSDEMGNYALTWNPTEAGNYLIRGAYDGNQTVSPTSKTVSLAILPYEQKSVFSVTSNSTITSFAFNSTAKYISLSVTGPNGTSGYTQLTIPKTMVTDISDLQVYLDGSQVNCTVKEHEDYWLISLSYHHSSHMITVAIDPQSQTLYGDIPIQLAYTVLAVTVICGIAALAVLLLITRSSKPKR